LLGKYVWKSYEEVYRIAQHLAKGMALQKIGNTLQYEGNELRIIGIYSKTREEWCITDIACWMNSITSVPLYDTLGEESISWIFDQTEMSTVFMSASSIEKIGNMVKKGLVKTLKNIVSFEEPDIKSIDLAKELGINIIPFSKLIEQGKEAKVELKPCKPEDLITICYTSGTTAKCKGVEINHQAFRDDAFSNINSGVFTKHFPGMVYISFLPLAHVFERVMHYCSIIGSFSLGYYSGDVLKIRDDIAELKPDMFVGVPRIYFRFYDVIMAGIDKTTGFKKTLVKRAIDVKTAQFKSSYTWKHWLYDTFVLSKIRNVLGGRVFLFVSSAAPLDANMIMMFQILFSVDFVQGYGQTETAGAISLSHPSDLDRASLGPPLICNQIKLQDVPEMNYKSTDMISGENIPRGEILVRGSNIFKKYFKDPAKTKETIDIDGWAHTGDIGMISKEGCIRIIDRKKNIFKLQQGEYVAPEKIENVLANCKWVSQIFVYGDSFQTYIIAIVVPKKEIVLEWAKAKGK